MEAQELQVGPLSNLASVLLPVTILTSFLSLYLTVKYASAILLPFTLNLGEYTLQICCYLFCFHHQCTIINKILLSGVLKIGYAGKYVR